VRPHEILFWFLILLLPVQLGKHFWPDFSLVFGIRIDYLSPTIYLTDILVLLLLLLWGIERLRNSKFKIAKSKYPFKILKRFLFPSSVFCFLLLNSLLSQNPGAALYKLAKIVEFFLLGLYVAKNNSSITNYQLPITLALSYSSLISIAQFFKQASLGGVFWFLGERSFNIQTPGIALGELSGRLFLRPYGTFSHPNSLAGFLLISLILISLITKIFRYLALILGVAVLILSFSRAVWLAGALAGLWLAARGLWKRKVKKGNLLLAIGCLMITILVGLSLFGVNEKPTQERIQLIKSSLEMIKSNPISGVGLNNFIVRLPEYWQSGQTRLLQPVHNIYLLILTETGLVGFLIFLWFLVLTFKRLLCYRIATLLIALSVILLLGLFDHYWFTLQQNQLLLAIVLGLVWREKETKPEEFKISILG